MMIELFLIAFLTASSLAAKGEKLSCTQIFCGAGRECVEGSGEPYCDCVEKCHTPLSNVCGSDGVTYTSECELYQKACKDSKQVELVTNTSCPAKEIVPKAAVDKVNIKKNKPNPVVCLENDRDMVREALIGLIVTEREVLGDEVDIGVDVKLANSLRKYFDSLDSDKDGSLDTMEFMKLMDKNKTIGEMLSSDSHSNPVLKGLCVDALISITDTNSDYKLEFDEFQKCLNPRFKPEKKMCDLDGVKFSDGQQIENDCNTCTCACGSWVCTSLVCENVNKEKDAYNS